MITLPDERLFSETILVSAEQDVVLDFTTQSEAGTQTSEATQAEATQPEGAEQTTDSEVQTEETAGEVTQPSESIAESDDTEVPDETGAANTLVLKEDEAGIKISSNLPNVRIVFENMGSIQEFALDGVEGTLTLPADVYNLRCLCPRHQTYRRCSLSVKWCY